jgi:hypothetical protein
MASPIAKQGWYRAGPKGLEYVCGLDEEPSEQWDLVKVEFTEQFTEEPLF